MKAILAAALTLLVANPSTAQDREFPIAEQPVLQDRYPDRLTSWPNGVTSLADVSYSRISGFRPMTMDIYMPPRSAGPRPLILHIHGGSWSGGHKRQSGANADFPSVLASLAAEGFVVASVDYRLTGEAPFPAQLQDVRSALRFLKAHAGDYGIDPTRAAVWGGSAGGHLAALSALTCGVTSLDPVGSDALAGSECVQAAVTWYGVFDFSGRPEGNDSLRRLLLCDICAPSEVAALSPVTYVDASDPPMLLIHGVDDSVVPVEQSRIAERLLREAGVPVQSIYIDGVNHSFIGATPEATRIATLRALNATFDFFHAQLDGSAE